MLKNYLRIALRNLWKNKGFSAINITGLALGMACSLLILLWVQDERNMDAFHRNGDRLFYLYERNYMRGKLETWYWTQGPLAEELKREIPEVQAATPLSWKNTNTFAIGDKTLKEEGYAAGADFFTMFSYPLVEGSAKDALSSSTGVAISRKMAVQFFGSPETAIGKMIRYENKKDFLVTAVFEDMPSLANDRVDYVLPWTGYLEDNGWARGWGAVDPRTCILLRPGASAAAVEKKIANLPNKFDTEEKNIRIELGMQRFSDYYLHTEFSNGVPTAGRIEYVRLFSIVALFILIIACINFMNLTTARSAKRATEIGVRKVMGAVRGLLIRQFIAEAILMASLSALLALVIVSLALPAFDQLTGKSLSLPYDHKTFWLSIGGITVLTGLLSGSYPAFYLSGFNPINVLKAAHPAGMQGSSLFRQGLVVFQFVLSIVLILATVLITRQIRYMQNAKLGYDRENLVYIPIEGNLHNKPDVFRVEADRLPGIKGTSLLSDNPTVMNNGTLSIGWTGKDPNEHIRFIHEAIGPEFLKTMNIQLVAGRDFSPAYPTDSLGCILNETAVALMGYKDPIGKPVYSGDAKFHIVGVVKDFHFQSLHEKIKPLLLAMGTRMNPSLSTILVRASPGKTALALAGLERLCKKMNPAFPFTYKFSDAEYTLLYASEVVTGRLSVIFAVLAIFISCLGLLGLSLFIAEQRRREIGIRKVLGASVSSLFGLLSKNFLKLVGLAYLISVPLGWWAMHQWLGQFAYRTDISWWIFGLSGIIAVLIALGTVGFQTIKVATANPIKSLKTE